MRKNYWMIVVISIATAIGLNNILLWIDLAKYSEAYQETAQRLYSPTLIRKTSRTLVTLVRS